MSTDVASDWRRIETHPGFVEKAATFLVFFIVSFSLPDRWFVGPEVEDASTALSRISVFLLVGGLCLRVLPHGELWRRVIALDLRLHAFIGLILMSVFWSFDREATLRQGGELAIITVFAGYVFMRYRMREWLELAAWSASLGAVANLAFVFGLPAFGVEGDGWTGVLQNKNLLALQALFDIIVLTAAASANPRWRRVFRLAAILALATLIGSQGKTSLVGFILTAAVIPVYIGFRGRRSLPGAVAAAFVAVAVFVIAFATANLGFITELFGKDITLTGRTEIWRLLADLVVQRPILGYGFGGTFGGYFSPVHDIWVSTTWEPRHAHNSLYQILLDLGLVGLGLFIWMYARSVRRAISFVRNVPGALGLFPLTVLTAAFVISLAETGVVASWSRWLFFTLAVLSCAASSKPPAATPATGQAKAELPTAVH